MMMFQNILNFYWKKKYTWQSDDSSSTYTLTWSRNFVFIGLGSICNKVEAVQMKKYHKTAMSL